VHSGEHLSMLVLCHSDLSILTPRLTHFSVSVSKIFRQNFTHCALFNTQSDKEIKSMYDECSGLVSFPHFKDIFAAYTREKHSYLWVDNIRRTLADSF
jgi:hypothetical protein